MWKNSIKNEIAKNVCEHVARAGADSNTKSKWLPVTNTPWKSWQIIFQELVAYKPFAYMQKINISLKALRYLCGDCYCDEKML